MTAIVLSNRKLIGLQNRTFYTQQELAETTGIETVPYGLNHIGSVELAYITKRIDRDNKGNKFEMEDTWHLTSRKTEDKCKVSHEQIAKTVKQFSANPVFGLQRFLRVSPVFHIQ